MSGRQKTTTVKVKILILYILSCYNIWTSMVHNCKDQHDELTCAKINVFMKTQIKIPIQSSSKNVIGTLFAWCLSFRCFSKYFSNKLQIMFFFRLDLGLSYSVASYIRPPFCKEKVESVLSWGVLFTRNLHLKSDLMLMK